jgi:hypothetical protein
MPPLSRHRQRLLIPLLFALLAMAAGCRQEKAAPTTVAQAKQCTGCHGYTLDPNHDFGCTACHGGVEPATSPEAAHAGLIAEPAHPERMATTCGRCHGELTKHAAQSPHFTLANEVNSVRRAFGATKPLANLTEVPVHETIASPLDLADDLLRRRCLRCHIGSKGDGYSETTRATGCAACHLDYQGGKLVSHQFRKQPADQSCLHCHYGNFAGADYHGRFEHDFGAEFRTPYTADGGSERPYGVEYHPLSPDVHARAGMTCIDCHSGRELMGLPAGGTGTAFARITCETCHVAQGSLPPGLDLKRSAAGLILTTKAEGKELLVPRLAHPAHRTYGTRVACAVCHAQWSFNDEETHLLRTDSANLAPWSLLPVQGSLEVENRFSSESSEPPTMRDALTGKPAPGIWLKGYRQRRWETILIGRDSSGRLVVMRPILNLSLSHIDSNDQLRFDAVKAQSPNGGLLPYTPHTIGKAGAFYRERLQIPNPRPTP